MSRLKRAWTLCREFKVFQFVRTALVVFALVQGWQAQEKANQVAHDSQAKAVLAAKQAHEGCLRGQRALPVLVKGLKAMHEAQTAFPDLFPTNERVSQADIRFYESLLPAKC